WHLLIPLAASVGSCLLLYGLLIAVADPPAETPLEPGPRFMRFLGLYWMTAPLAWIYAIPVEGWLSPLGAVRFNLYLLTIVALWRVLLISRATAVLFGTSFPRIIFPVLLFGDGLMLFITHFIPLPIFQVMGGLRMSSTEAAIVNFAYAARMLGWLTLPLWLAATVRVSVMGNDEARDWRVLRLRKPTRKVSPALWGLAVASLLIWVPILPF